MHVRYIGAGVAQPPGTGPAHIFIHRRVWLATVAIMILLATVLSVRFIWFDRVEHQQPDFPLETHEPIVVGGDGDFTPPNRGFGCECVRMGSGASDDPYVIAGWKINSTGSVGITVRQTTSWYIVKQVSVTVGELYDGIQLVSAPNGRIENATVMGGFKGIMVSLSTNVHISQLVLEDNEFGVHLETTDDSSVNQTHVTGVKQIGIFVRGSRNLITTNNVTSSGYGGINIDGTAGNADDNVIEDNTVTSNAAYGIILWRANRNIVRSNLVADNGASGIALADSNSNSIRYNTVTANNGDGILVGGTSSNNLIQNNQAEGNGDGAADFDLHDATAGVSNTWGENVAGTRQPASLQ